MGTPLRLTTIAILLPLGCASSHSASPPATADGTDAGTIDGTDASDTADGTDVQTCGNPPFVTLGIVVEAAKAGGNGTPIEGAKLTIPLCADKSQLSDSGGHITGRISKGVPFYARFEASGYAPTLVAEQKFDADESPIVAPLPPSLFTLLVPGGFGDNSTAIVVALQKDGGAGPCNALDGARFEVLNHPEAKVTYFTSDAIPMATTGTTTTDAGQAVISGIAAPGGAAPFVTVRGSKDGCTVTLVKNAYTGRIPLEAGFVTITPAYLH